LRRRLGFAGRPSGAALAIGAAVLFGASTPLAKLLLREGLAPQLLAGLFYLGSGVGLSLLLLLRRLMGSGAGEARLRLSDLPQLSVAVLLGGAVAPVLLMAGLARTTAASASLLLNLEGLVTMAIAWLVLRENVDRRLLVGAFAILAGAVLLSWSGGSVRPDIGAVLVAGACVAWGIDNNVTRSLARADPMQIAAVKGLVAGSANLSLALLLTHASVPSGPSLGAAAVIGFLSYGVSLVLFVLGLRNLGTARTAAYFSTAPFIGALLAVGLFSEPVTGRLLAAGVLMGVGLYLHLREEHMHAHTHEELEHEHRHVHDEHHQHSHAPSDPPGEPHSHRHRHLPLTHSHAHFPDLHHRHEHS
jgi:drug/metabolite transporter (DMT)-like permease